MSTGTILALSIAVLVVLAGVMVFATTRARDRASAIGALSRETRQRDKRREKEETTEVVKGKEVERQAVLARVGGDLVPAEPSPAPVAKAPLDPDAYGVTRRQFFNRSIVGMFALGLGAFGATNVAFLWPQLSGGFGSKIRAGNLQDILDQIRETKEPVYKPEGRFYLQAYPKDAVGKAKNVYTGGVLEGMEAGVVALYQKCVHLGCRVPWCKSSQWFECPCHGSQYNRVGERKAGPAPRGLDRFAVEVSGGVVSVDTAAVILGPPSGTNTTGQELEGPHCA